MKTFHPLLATAVATALLASACATAPYQASGPYEDPNYPASNDPNYPNNGTPPPPERDVNHTGRNAAIGAGIGIVAGLLSGDDATERRQHALIGAGVGALAGGAVGHYQDRQEDALRERMANTGVDVVRQGDNITLDIPSGITFNVDSAEILPGFRGVLDRVAQTLGEYDQSIIEVAGHTDNTGTDAYNQALSERRARAVGDYLSARGINRERVITIGAGETRPVASNDTEAGRAENRRVELTVVPLTNG